MLTRSFALLAVLFPLLDDATRAENWTEFRGPTGQGVVREGSLPTEWSQTKNVVWKQAVPGSGWSSPVVVDGRIYLTSAVLVAPSKDQSLQALCLDAVTGKVLWQQEVFHRDGKTTPGIHGKNSYASATPVVQGDRLYVHFGPLGTACLDLAGKVLWRNTNLGYSSVHGNGGSPILVDDLLVFSCDGTDKQILVALEADSGKVRWQTDRKSTASRRFSFSTPLLIEVQGRKQIISSASDLVGAYDPTNGKEIWRVRFDGYSVIPRPVFGHGLVFIATGYESPTLIAVRPDGEGDVTDSHVVWTVRRHAPLTPSPLLHGDELYMVSDAGFASCLDAKTGKVRWQERLGGAHSASPVVADGKIYFQSEDGVGAVVKAGTKFEVVSRNALEERTLASYAAADGGLFIRTKENLYRIQAR
jgi:outer membrane protein assembly factor BamB